MVKRIYNMKKTLSMKGFISELGKDFSKHMKNRLLELELRTVLTRNEHSNRLDLKHVEHIQYSNTWEDGSPVQKKEFTYGQFVVVEGLLYYAERCKEDAKVMQAPIVKTIYDSLSSENMLLDEDGDGKKIDDTNIDYVVDTIMTACPPVSQSYLDIISKYDMV